MRKSLICFIIFVTMIFSCFFVSCSSKENNNIDFIELVKKEADYMYTESWKVPDFTGWSCAEVTNVLDEIGQKYEITFVNDENANNNAITGQYPSQGGIVKKNEKIQLKVNNYYAKSNSIRFFYSYMNPIAETGKWIFFTDGSSIYRSCNDFNYCEKIYNNEDNNEKIVSIIPRENEIIFLVQNKSSDFSIYSINTDGKEYRKIFEPEGCMDLFSSGDTLNIFYGVLRQYNIKENEIKDTDLIIPSFSFMQYESYRYYINSKGDKGPYLLCKQNIEGGSVTTLIESDKQILNLCLYDNNLYYVSVERNSSFTYDEWLYKFDLKLNENTLIKKINSNTSVSNYMCVWGNSLVLTNDNSVLKVNIKDNNEITINRPSNIDQVSYCILCGNYIYQCLAYPNSGMALLDGRYNLFTDKYEEFDWQSICQS